MQNSKADVEDDWAAFSDAHFVLEIWLYNSYNLYVSNFGIDKNVSNYS